MVSRLKLHLPFRSPRLISIISLIFRRVKVTFSLGMIMANAGNVLEMEDYFCLHPEAYERFALAQKEVTGVSAKIIQLRPKFPKDLFKDQNLVNPDGP
jgi:hypothetical protein